MRSKAHTRLVNFMTLTSVDIPTKLLEFMDELIGKGLKRTRREIFLEALTYYANLRMHQWDPPIYRAHGRSRVVLVEVTALNQILGLMDEDGQLNAGRILGRVLKDILLVDGAVNSSKRENWKATLELLERHGWGHFQLAEDEVFVTDAGLPPRVLRACLEVLTGAPTDLLTESESVAVVRIGEGKRS